MAREILEYVVFSSTRTGVPLEHTFAQLMNEVDEDNAGQKDNLIFDRERGYEVVSGGPRTHDEAYAHVQILLANIVDDDDCTTRSAYAIQTVDQNELGWLFGALVWYEASQNRSSSSLDADALLSNFELEKLPIAYIDYRAVDNLLEASAAAGIKWETEPQETRGYIFEFFSLNSTGDGYDGGGMGASIHSLTKTWKKQKSILKETFGSKRMAKLVEHRLDGDAQAMVLALSAEKAQKAQKR
ncbi:hypothetical protein [Cryobacterium aureum]|uniref:hypothetical protein n=1 Tax=Cryobacterium aureum TaxID=995037 RepID=UPI000CF3DE80|nr:hypothetical protein [Cryobacterium aureum]